MLFLLIKKISSVLKILPKKITKIKINHLQNQNLIKKSYIRMIIISIIYLFNKNHLKNNQKDQIIPNKNFNLLLQQSRNLTIR